MKKIIILLLATILFTACEYDNYDAPSVTFSGQLLYNDKPFLCDGNDARDIFLFFQEGFGKVDWERKCTLWLMVHTSNCYIPEDIN